MSHPVKGNLVVFRLSAPPVTHQSARTVPSWSGGLCRTVATGAQTRLSVTVWAAIFGWWEFGLTSEISIIPIVVGQMGHM